MTARDAAHLGPETVGFHSQEVGFCQQTTRNLWRLLYYGLHMTRAAVVQSLFVCEVYHMLHKKKPKTVFSLFFPVGFVSYSREQFILFHNNGHFNDLNVFMLKKNIEIKLIK